MNNVYLIIYDDYERTDIIRIFSSLEKAREYFKIMNFSENFYFIQKRSVD